ncbi:MAG: YgiQ family radical SAM protein [Thermodesulfobacteria bacterium]|nr:YgiQ family radical SAM protein [Thermodesulfobacteriota bacterium]
MKSSKARKNQTTSGFLPATRKEMEACGWDRPDIVLVTGDAYVDHPSFGISLIGRWLEAHGFRVAILAQPRHHNDADFKRFGRPRLFFGISSGNLDSIVANYTGNARIRQRDAYSPNGDPYFPGPRTKTNRRRPDRAVITYANLARRAYHDVPIVIGGIEASLRRFIHYDYQQEKLRNSILTDSKADILVYGMGELACLEIAKRLEAGQDLLNIPGTMTRHGHSESLEGEDIRFLPSWDDISTEPSLFLDAELDIDQTARSGDQRRLAQVQKGGTVVVQNRASRPLTTKEMDFLHELPFTRLPHPAFGRVPAWEMIKDSITVVRGCFGNCSFCAIARHQGPVITSRSVDSVLREVDELASASFFKGTVTDLGGPTANMYGVSCKVGESCKKKDCLFPKLCKNLELNQNEMRHLLKKVSAHEKVKNVFISSGLRMDMLLRTPELMADILKSHIPGALKIAPEHTEEEVLYLMHKPGGLLLEQFLKSAREILKKLGKRSGITAYFMTSHPGCTLAHMVAMGEKLKRLRLPVRQFQDFTPTPGTISTAMYVTELDRYDKRPIFVAKRRKDRAAQRKILESLMNKKKGAHHEKDLQS